jgi:hypothetical protein
MLLKRNMPDLINFKTTPCFGNHGNFILHKFFSATTRYVFVVMPKNAVPNLMDQTDHFATRYETSSRY